MVLYRSLVIFSYWAGLPLTSFFFGEFSANCHVCELKRCFMKISMSDRDLCERWSLFENIKNVLECSDYFAVHFVSNLPLPTTAFISLVLKISL